MRRLSLFLGAALALAACTRAPQSPPARTNPEPSEEGLEMLVYLIHGAANYTWHDAGGTRHRADTEAVAKALETARRSGNAEVFIFHQTRPHIPFGPDGRMWHFRRGVLLREESYRQSGLGGFWSEGTLFRRRASPACSRAVLVYFGHEIPAFEAVAGLRRFAPQRAQGKPFSLVVLSACHGGTPAMTQALAPYTDYLLASPGELHLSFLDTRLLARLDSLSPRAAGMGIAEVSFARLQEQTRTAITLSLYETDQAWSYLEARRGAWDFVGKTYQDCGDAALFGSGGPEAGATVFYRAPRFGPEKSKLSHSGWECPTLPQPSGLSYGHASNGPRLRAPDVRVAGSAAKLARPRAGKSRP